MKPLNKNLAYDCSNLSEEEMREFKKNIMIIHKQKRKQYSERKNVI